MDSREAVRLQPASSVAHYHLGRVLFLQKRYAEAIAAFLKAKELSPSSDTPDFGLVQVYNAQANYDKALAVLANQSLGRSTPSLPFNGPWPLPA